MKASKITPSNPNHCAKGSKNDEQCNSNELSFTVTFAKSQITAPAGTATITERASTNRVRSNTERISTCPNCGLRKGGSSSVKEEGNPFKSVLESSFVVKNVAKTPSSIAVVNRSDDKTEPTKPVPEPIKKRVMIATKAGKRPLHGTNALVRIASILSRGESMIRHPTTPAALHPNPMHIESACFPQALQR